MKLRYKILGGLLALVLLAVTSLAIAIGYTADCEPPSAVADNAQLMKAVVYRCYGSPDVLEYSDVPKPVPADNEVLVKVMAASVNPLDWHYMRGSPFFMRLGVGLGAPEDTRLGVDFAGIVESVGKNVTRYKPGDEVFGGASGAFAEYLVIREDRALATKPANVTFEEAASVTIAGVTALQALRDHGALQAGQKVLINGASGGVGTFAVQIAKSMGAEVTGVCSTRNVEMVTAIGADHVIDYKKQNYTDGDERYDLIVDMVSNHGLLANTKVIQDSGALVMVGGPTGDWLKPLAGPLKAMLMSPFLDQRVGMMLGRLSPEDLAFIAELMQAGAVTPVIDQRFSLAEVADAIRYSETGRARGKIIINVAPGS
ncbi:MAG: NAD(P)-dependent alcohol dehydrogenase [Woeseiaceae bacterium]